MFWCGSFRGPLPSNILLPSSNPVPYLLSWGFHVPHQYQHSCALCCRHLLSRGYCPCVDMSCGIFLSSNKHKPDCMSNGLHMWCRCKLPPALPRGNVLPWKRIFAHFMPGFILLPSSISCTFGVPIKLLLPGVILVPDCMQSQFHLPSA